MLTNFKWIHFIYWCSFLDQNFLIPTYRFNCFTHKVFSQNCQFLIPLSKRLIIYIKFFGPQRYSISLFERLMFHRMLLLHSHVRFEYQDKNQNHKGHRHLSLIISYNHEYLINLKITKFCLDKLIHLILRFRKGRLHQLDNMFEH